MSTMIVDVDRTQQQQLAQEMVEQARANGLSLVGPDGVASDRVLEEMAQFWTRPLERVYAAIFIDAIMVKVRDGQVANQPFYAAIGVDLNGHKDILGIWPGHGGGESAKFWFASPGVSGDSTLWRKENGVMSNTSVRYSPELKARAVRMVSRVEAGL